MADLRS